MKIFDTFKSLISAPDTSPIKLADAIAQASRVLEEVRAEKADLEAKREILLIAPEAERTKHKQLIAAAADRVEDAELFLSRLEGLHRETVEREAETARQRNYDEAVASRDAAAKRLAKEYPDIMSRMLSLLVALAESEVKVQAVNARLSEDEEPILSAETLVRADVKSGTVQRSERIELWCYEGSNNPVPDEIAAEIIGKGSHGYREHVSGPAHGVQQVHKSHFEKRTFIRQERYEATPLPQLLPLNVWLPPLKSSGPGWNPSTLRSQRPEMLLATLRTAGEAVAVEPNIITELVPA